MSSNAALIDNQSKPWLTPRVATILVDGAATINGNISNSSNPGTSTFAAATFASAFQITTTGTATFNQPSNQLILKPNGGAANTLSINCAAPAVSRVITLPDPGAAANVIYDVLAQSVSGVKTFSAQPILSAASNQLKIQPSGAGFSFIVNAAANPAADTTLTMYDPANATVPLQLGVLKSKAITAITSLTAADSGALCNTTQGAYAITLPAVATSNGVYFKFVLGTAAAATCTIVPVAGTTLNAQIIMPTGNVVAAANKGTFTFVSGTAVVGDYAEFYCNGAIWSIFARTGANGGITVA